VAGYGGAAAACRPRRGRALRAGVRARGAAAPEIRCTVRYCGSNPAPGKTRGPSGLSGSRSRRAGQSQRERSRPSSATPPARGFRRRCPPPAGCRRNWSPPSAALHNPLFPCLLHLIQNDHRALPPRSVGAGGARADRRAARRRPRGRSRRSLARATRPARARLPASASPRLAGGRGCGHAPGRPRIHFASRGTAPCPWCLGCQINLTQGPEEAGFQVARDSTMRTCVGDGGHRPPIPPAPAALRGAWDRRVVHNWLRDESVSALSNGASLQGCLNLAVGTNG
jgi:hypothetical protein